MTPRDMQRRFCPLNMTMASGQSLTMTAVAATFGCLPIQCHSLDMKMEHISSSRSNFSSFFCNLNGFCVKVICLKRLRFLVADFFFDNMFHDKFQRFLFYINFFIFIQIYAINMLYLYF